MNINDFKIKLEFTIEEMNMIFRFLGSIPHDQVWGLIKNLNEQVEPQLAPPESFTENDLNNNDNEHPF
jgi:hypothetical protein